MNYSVSGVKFRYREKPVLDGVDLDIQQGEVFGILGPNGCGKTTLLKILNRNLTPHEGAVMIDGTSLSDISKKEIARNIAVVPQGNEIKFSFTVEDIVSMGRMPYKRQFEGLNSDDDRIVEEALASTGLTEMKDKPINEMSGGERQRVIIAKALVQSPRILLMDEPTNHLDVNMQFEVLDLVRNLSRERGLTVIIVSHDLPMAARYCDRVAMIKDHRVFAMGDVESVLTEENIREVFNVEGTLATDDRTGLRTVILHGVASGR